MSWRRIAGELLHRTPARWHGALPPDVRYRLRSYLGRSPWSLGGDDPPTPADGEHVAPPDFIGIGTQKAGTTWWYQLIAAHPGVAPSCAGRKELHFLSRLGASPFGPAQQARYERWFPRAPGQLSGEWTPDYLHLPWVPALAADAAPRARLLVCLRDPVERFRSGLTLNQLIIRAQESIRLNDAMVQGFYAQHLRRWLEHYDRDQILVLQHEQNVRDPKHQLERTYEFLGLDPTYAPEVLGTTFGETSRKMDLDAPTLGRLRDLYLPDVVDLQRLVPDLDLSLWRNFATVRGA